MFAQNSGFASSHGGGGGEGNGGGGGSGGGEGDGREGGGGVGDSEATSIGSHCGGNAAGRLASASSLLTLGLIMCRVKAVATPMMRTCGDGTSQTAGLTTLLPFVRLLTGGSLTCEPLGSLASGSLSCMRLAGRSLAGGSLVGGSLVAGKGGDAAANRCGRPRRALSAPWTSTGRLSALLKVNSSITYE